MAFKAKYSYNLVVDPDRLDTKKDIIRNYILRILVKNGGHVSRENMVRAFTRELNKRRPHLKQPATTVLSYHQRLLRDARIIKLVDDKGKIVRTKARSDVPRVS